ncbi:MAG: TonB-dependent receptor, partial [Sphingobacteriales bacterium]
GLQSSGEPGRNGANIFIRGVSTYAGGNSSQPLVVIDNVEQAPERAYDQLNSMDANEIENISVLKDASATAVYGIRGANGVIIVTTKRGRVSRPALSVSTNFGFTKATRLLHNANSYQYALMRNEAIRTEASAFGNSTFTNNLFSDRDIQRLLIGRDYLPEEVDAMTNLTADQKQRLKNSPALYYGSRDLFADQFSGTGPQKQINLNVTGGSNKVKYFVSLGYFSQGSIINSVDYYGAKIQSSFDRYNFRSNFDIDVVKNLQISVNLAGQFGETNGPGVTGGDAFNLDGRYKAIMQYIFDSNPLTAPGVFNGKLVNGYYGMAGSNSNPLGLVLGSLKGNQNAMYNLLISGNEALYNTFLSNSIVIRHNMSYLTKGLSIRGTANYDDNYIKTTTYQPSLPTYQVRRNPVDPNMFEFVGGAIGANSFNASPGRNSTWYKTYFDLGIDYNNRFGDHNITGLVMAKASKYYVPTQNNFFTPSAVLGFLGRVSYNYRERYLVELNAGYNGTEQFIEGKRFGFFPAYSAG